MSAILCRWLNQEVQLSKAVDPRTFARDFSSGYLIGEILHKHQIQDDFSMFLEMDTSISKVNNFKRLKPTLELLGICFDAKMTEDLMKEKPGVAIHLLYQLYVSLEKKKNPIISRTIIQPAAKTNLLKEEHELPQMTKRDFSMKRQQTCQHYGDKCQQLNTKSVVSEPIQQMGQLKIQDEKQIENVCHENINALTCNLTTKVQIKPPSHSLPLNTKSRKQNKEQAQKVKDEIDKFETNRKNLGIPGFPSSSSFSGQTLLVDFPPGGSNQGCKISGSGIQLMLQSNDKYIEEIHQRQRERAVACEQRERRKHRFLMEQLEAQKAQQEAQREEQLVKRLTREAIGEQHVLDQLMQIRRQKDAILQDRLVRDHQYRKQREKDFQKALDRDTVKQDK